MLTYDGNDNVLSRTTRASVAITYAYDTLDRLISKTRPSEPTVSYGYDLNSRLAVVSDNSTAMTAVSGSAAAYTTDMSYDPLNRPLSVSWDPAPTQAAVTSASVTMDHTYDATNRRTGQSITDDAWWTPPSVGSITNYTANNLNQYTAQATVLPSAGTVNPTHDNNGNLTFDGVFTYSYDSENRLTQISNGSTVATYASDAQGRRKSKTVGAAVTNYITDGGNRVVLEYDGSTGAVQRWYAYGPGTSNILNRMDVASATRATLIPDIQGSVIGRLDASTATLTTAGYLPFGGNAADTASGFRYTAQTLDPETAGSTSQPSGLYYYRARSYSPAWGRFLQPDPIGYADGGNLHAYVGNDPLNLVDPSGFAAASTLSAARPTLNAIDAIDRNAAVISVSTGMAIDLALAGPTGEGIPIAGAAFLGIKGLGAVSRGVRSGLQTLIGKGRTGAAKGIGNNPFKGKTPNQVDKMFKAKGFETRGPNPLSGKGGYVNPKTKRSFHIDPGGQYKRGTEYPHVDVNRTNGSNLPKKKYPLGDRLNDNQ